MNKDINKKLTSIYKALYAMEGSRHWWPAETQFEVLAGTILTQFVSWSNVAKAINNLKAGNVLSINGICEIEDSKLGEMIRCTRFYNGKVKKLKALCNHIRDKYKGSLTLFLEREITELRSELLSIYGIGEETADAIILYAADKPIFVVDSYTRRIFSRLGFFDTRVTYGEMQRFFMDNLLCDVWLYNDFHAQIDNLGNRYCFEKNPKCTECPVNTFCKY